MSVISLREILETNKLIGPNFDDWYRSLRIVIMHEKLIDVIDEPEDLILQSIYDAECFHYKKKEHWKRNCKEYLATLKDKKQSEILMKNIFKVSLATTNSSLWVLDTGSGYNICNMLQGFKISMRLKKGEVNIQVGNSAKVAAIPVRSISLIMPLGKVLMLDDCYYVLKFVSNIISASILDKHGFRIIIGNGICSIYYGDDLYVNGYFQHDVYVLPNVNVNLIMHVSSLKRKRDDHVNHTYLWHCRLGHIGEKRINKLYKEGYLDKYDFESYPTCESCLKGKMTKSPFTGSGERASELLGLIYTDVCGPIKIQARGRYSYFITFTDDMSRYEFVYLLKCSKGSVVKLRNRLKKIGADEKVETYKSRLVAKGYRQKEGVDYDETFSLVAMLKSIRILLAIAAYYVYEIWQMDVKTTFLNGELEEDVCEEEPCVYKKVSESTIIFLVLYVDDIFLIGNDTPALQSTNIWLSEQFSMKHLGEATYILEINICRDRSRKLLGLSQSLYIDTILKRYNMDNFKRGYIPIGTEITLNMEDCPKTPEERERMSRIPYASAVGAIMYTMTCTHPDVAYALGVTS
ncbi:uncharacterized protein [Nicotiana tomentosiformis]|uniref:uncharacterized protein n=1 Tax=Nicotiana tomentosiformis TaxID=4098 RepID=UPI00388C4DF7